MFKRKPLSCSAHTWLYFVYYQWDVVLFRRLPKVFDEFFARWSISSFTLNTFNDNKRRNPFSLNQFIYFINSRVIIICTELNQFMVYFRVIFFLNSLAVSECQSSYGSTVKGSSKRNTGQRSFFSEYEFYSVLYCFCSCVNKQNPS